MIGSERVPESNITKKVLAKALKNCMQTKSFAKITVMDICEECGMNRKTFYYHFKDKFDLVNWIFNIECLKQLHHSEYVFLWGNFETLCEYFYENKDFYREVFSYDGQNSFTEYFQEIFYALLAEDFCVVFPSLKGHKYESFVISLYLDVFVCGIKRWIRDPACTPPKEFCMLIKMILLKSSEAFVENFHY